MAANPGCAGAIRPVILRKVWRKRISSRPCFSVEGHNLLYAVLPNERWRLLARRRD
jgi:hypothetical protein